MVRNRFVQCLHLVALAALCGLPGVAGAQASTGYPARPIRVIVPNSAASMADIVARVVGERLSRRVGQPVVVDNLPGASGVVGTDQLARAPADGYTLGIVSNNHVINPSIHKVPYDVAKGFTTVSVLASGPMVLVVPTKSPYMSAAEFLAGARGAAHPLTFGSLGQGSIGHLCGELMASMGHFKMTHVAYRSQGNFMTELISGQIDSAFTAASVVGPFIKTGQLRVLAVSTPGESPVLPGVKPLAEVLPGYALDAWIALIAPAAVGMPVVDQLHREMVAVLSEPAVRADLLSRGIEVVANGPAAAQSMVLADIDKYARVARDAGLRPD